MLRSVRDSMGDSTRDSTGYSTVKSTWDSMACSTRDYKGGLYGVFYSGFYFAPQNILWGI